MLDESRNNFLSAISIGAESIGLCFVDASTGETLVTDISGDMMCEHAFDELLRFNTSELLISGADLAHPIFSRLLSARFEGAVTEREADVFEKQSFTEHINSQFGVISPENLGIPADAKSAAALGAAVEYLHETGKGGKLSVNSVKYYTEAQYMRLDMTAVRNLEICETMRSKAKKGSLLWVLDKTKTAMGKRLIRSWMLKPLLSITEITLRQNAVEELCSNTVMRCEGTEYLTGIRDIERLMTRAVYGTATARDLVQLAATAHRFPVIKELLSGSSSRMLKGIHDDIDTLDDIIALIDDAIVDEPPLTVKEGRIIRDGYNDEVDLLRHDMDGGADYIKEIEAKERETTGIKNLRVRFNKVFGYYIEVTNSFLDRVPEGYIRKQTLTNCERFITEELKNIETRVLTAKDRVIQLEYEIFDSIRKRVAGELLRFQRTAAALARFDVLCSFAQTAVDNNYCRPLVNNSGVINIKGGRHPVVEQVIKSPFVANDTMLDLNDDRCAIITGPNMAGKSTYMRQTAIITLMAQTGSYVPAQMAEIGIVDAVFTRVGASDDLASGQSTFMVEMSEVADILKNATKNSLLILDEIGRGTSTFDGMSIARAVLEYVADRRKLGAKALFATHYHELTEMENELKGVKNYNIAVKKRGDDIIFLRRIVRGGADDSYGIEVAKLSGIPNTVIDRAKAILRKVEEEGTVTYKTAPSPDAQLPIEMQSASDILHELQVLDVNTLTPIEDMGVLFDLANKAKSV